MREFIDKVKAKGIIASGKDDKAYFGLTSNDQKVIDFLNEVPTVTEQEIVRPYLKNILRIIEDVELNAYEKVIRIEDSMNQDLAQEKENV